MSRNTNRDVRAAFALLAHVAGWKTNGKPLTDDWDGTHYLEEWSPGDGCTRYRVMVGSGQSACNYGPLGSNYWSGASEALSAMWAAIRAIKSMRPLANPSEASASA